MESSFKIYSNVHLNCFCKVHTVHQSSLIPHFSPSCFIAFLLNFIWAVQISFRLLYSFFSSFVVNQHQANSPNSCADLECFFGAKCHVRNGHAECLCDAQCPSDSSSATPVCGSDGETYGSECHLKLYACRYQKDVVVDSLGPCPPLGKFGHSFISCSSCTSIAVVFPCLLQTVSMSVEIFTKHVVCA